MKAEEIWTLGNEGVLDRNTHVVLHQLGNFNTLEDLLKWFFKCQERSNLSRVNHWIWNPHYDRTWLSTYTSSTTIYTEHINRSHSLYTKAHGSILHSDWAWLPIYESRTYRGHQNWRHTAAKILQMEKDKQGLYLNNPVFRGERGIRLYVLV